MYVLSSLSIWKSSSTQTPSGLLTAEVSREKMSYAQNQQNIKSTNIYIIM